MGVANFFATGFIAYLLVEIAFWYFVTYNVFPVLNSLTEAPKCPCEPAELVRKVISQVASLDCYSLDKFLHGWFLGADPRSVHRENLMDFLAWVCN